MSLNLLYRTKNFAVSFLKYRLEDFFGKETLDIFANTVSGYSEIDTWHTLERLLDTSDGKQLVQQAIIRAYELFREKCNDDKLKLLFSLSTEELNQFEITLTDLSYEANQDDIKAQIRNMFEKDYSSPLSKSQIEYGTNLFYECLNQALLPVNNYTLTIVGNAVFDIQEDIQEIKKHLEKTTSFSIIDTEYRIKYGNRIPGDFYDGRSPNWANIANNDDAEREMFSRLFEFTQEKHDGVKVGLLRGLAGEGKSTIIMRLAWELSKNGELVIWKNTGFPLLDANLPRHLSPEKTAFIFIDELSTETELPGFINQLHIEQQKAVIIGASRSHEWNNAGMESEVRKYAKFQHFPLGRLSINESNGIIAKLENSGKLDHLAYMSHDKRTKYFIDRINSDGQLLPAMISARYGENGFTNRIENVLASICQRNDHELLLNAYSLIAIIHRFGYRVPRKLLACVFEIAEDAIDSKIINPFGGFVDDDIMEIFEELGQLQTRHAVIAEKAIEIIEEKRWAKTTISLYKKYFNCLGKFLSTYPKNSQTRLLTIIPLFYEHEGNFKIARELFDLGIKADPTDVPSYQAWALMENKAGNTQRARELFDLGIKADPTNAHLWQAWALMENKVGNTHRARELFDLGTKADPTNAHLWQAWALMENKAGNTQRARELFQLGIKADPTDAHLWQAWALMENKAGNTQRARELFNMGIKADPTNAPLWQAWALMENKAGNTQRARELFDLGIKADPTHAPSYQAWALMENKAGNTQRARELFNMGIKADPTHAPSYQAWALMEHELSNYKKAEKILLEGLSKVKLQKEKSYLMATMARVLGRLERTKESEQMYEKAISIHDNRFVRFFFAEFLMFHERYEQSYQNYTEAVKLRIEYELHFQTLSNKQIKYRMKRVQKIIERNKTNNCS